MEGWVGCGLGWKEEGEMLRENGRRGSEKPGP